jgi:micrococcal nuclease
MNKMTVILAAALAFCTAHAQAEQYRVVGIMDGDTVKVLSSDRQQIKCRLSGIDAPESNQAFGQRSKQSLSDMIFQKQVEITVVDQDRYGRSVCLIILNGVDINKVQIQRGMAWHYVQYSRDASYAQAEASAQQQRLGLWADSNPTPPWIFRHSNKAVSYR